MPGPQKAIMAAGKKGDSSIYVPTNQTHIKCVLCPRPRVGLSLSPKCSTVGGGRPGFHAKLDTAQGSGSNKGGGLSLPREMKGSIILLTAFTPHPGQSHLPPKHLWEFSILSVPTVSTLIQTSSSHSGFTAIVAYLVFPLQYHPSNPFLHQPRMI